MSIKNTVVMIICAIAAMVIMTGMWYEGYLKGNAEGQTISVYTNYPVTSKMKPGLSYIYGEYGGGDKMNDWKTPDF